jgi:hypothetical protein
MKFKLKEDSSLRTNGLCDLEEILGESNGHGIDMGGEDIDWCISKPNKNSDHWFVLDMNLKGEWIEIRHFKFYKDINKECENIGLGFLPIEWLTKIQDIVYEHCSNKREDILIEKRI